MDALNRVVVGFLLPPAIHPVVAALQTEIKRRGADSTFRGTPMSEMAVAVCTPGEVTPATLQRIVAAIRHVAAQTPVFAITLGGLTGEPNATQPRAAVLMIEGDGGKLEALGNAILRTAMITSDTDNGYKPRVELGRLKQLTEAGRTNLGRAIRMVAKPEALSFPVAALEVLIAHASPAGPELRVFERIQLSEGGVVPPPVM